MTTAMTSEEILGVVGLRRRRMLAKGGTRDDDDYVNFTMAEEDVLVSILDDDYVILTDLLPTEAPTTTHLASSTSPKEKFMDISLILIWCCFGVVAVYYFLTEQQRRRRRLRRQRQERLEQFSPCKQAKRRIQLTQVLMATTVEVKLEYLECPDENGGSATDMDHYLVHGVLGNDDISSLRGEMLSEGGKESEGRKAGSAQSRGGPDKAETPSCDDEEEGGEESESEDGQVQRLCRAKAACTDLSSSSWQSDDNGDGDGRTFRLPRGINSSLVAVPANCAICLKQYRVKDWVSWSPNSNNQHQPGNHRCPHAFHRDCIVEWLAKLPGCNCPVCRNVFCRLPSTKRANNTSV
jgi:hypothetical protein